MQFVTVFLLPNFLIELADPNFKIFQLNNSNLSAFKHVLLFFVIFLEVEGCLEQGLLCIVILLF